MHAISVDSMPAAGYLAIVMLVIEIATMPVVPFGNQL